MKSFLRKSISLLLVVLFLFSFPLGTFALNSTLFDAQYVAYLAANGLSETGLGSADIIYAARAMLGKTGSQVGATSAWSASFISACADTIGQSKAIPSNTKIKTLCSKIKSAGGKVIYDQPNKKGNPANALPGDIIVYKTSSTWGQAEIVTKKLNSSDIIKSIGGDNGTTHKSAKVQEHSWGKSKITYIIRPNYVTKPIVVNVKFNANGGTVKKTSMTVIYGEPYGTLPTPTRKGYTFVAWRDNEGDTVTAETKVAKKVEHTLKAAWKKAFLLWDANGGTLTINGDSTYVQYLPNYTDSSTFTSGSLLEVERTGYKLDGWYAKDGSKVLSGVQIKPYLFTELVAHWTKVETSTAKIYGWKQTDSKWSSKFSGIPWSTSSSVVALAIQIARTDLVRVSTSATTFNTKTKKGFNPATLAKIVVSKSMVDSTGKMQNWKKVTDILPGFVYVKRDYNCPSKWSYGSRTFSYFPCKTKQDVVAAMTYYLSLGYYPIVEGPGPKWASTTRSRHFVAVVATTASDVIVVDPGTGKTKSIFNISYWSPKTIEQCGVPSGYGSCVLFKVDKSYLIPAA